MSKNIVVLSGSPRKSGNTETLVAAFKEGAESAGKTVTVFRTAHIKISACTGCEYCIGDTKACTIKDDMTEVLEALHNADVVVWASPIYYFSLTAQLKAAIDRTYPLRSESAKRTALLLTCADESSDTAEGALTIYQKTVEYYGWDNAGVIIATGVEHIGDIAGHTALVQAKKLGQAI